MKQLCFFAPTTTLPKIRPDEVGIRIPNFLVGFGGESSFDTATPVSLTPAVEGTRNFLISSATTHNVDILGIFKRDAHKHTVLASGQVVPDSARCVQCGICTYNCPIGIDVRAHAWRGEPVKHSQCITCGECVARCPRGVLRFEQIDLFSTGES